MRDREIRRNCQIKTSEYAGIGDAEFHPKSAMSGGRRDRISKLSLVEQVRHHQTRAKLPGRHHGNQLLLNQGRPARIR